MSTHYGPYLAIVEANPNNNNNNPNPTKTLIITQIIYLTILILKIE